MSSFDEAKYAALLQDLEITVLPFSQINLGDRADPEFYSKENLAIEHSLRNHHAQPIGNYCTLVASAFYPAATDLYESGDVPFARCVDCINHPFISKLQDDSFERIPRWFMEQSGQIQRVGAGDIILTKVGTPCYASVVHDYGEIALSRTVLGLVNIKGVNPYYLTAFLRSRFGFNQLMRQRELTIQYQLTLERVRAVLVYQASDKLQKSVEAIMLRYIAELVRASETTKQAEQSLLRALGIENWQPQEPLSYTRKASEAFAAGRLDAEHYQPKYDDMLRQIRTKGVDLIPLGELILPVKNGFDWRDFVDEGTPYIRVGDISQCRINMGSAEKVSLTAANVKKDIVLRVGDVLFTRKGSFGNAAPVREGDEHAIISSEIMLVRRKAEHEKELLPEYLALFFNSIAGNLQAEKWAHGAAFYSVSQDDLNRFLIPMISGDKQGKVGQLLETSEMARRQAVELLNRAKRAVELAIEEDESAAIEFINSDKINSNV